MSKLFKNYSKMVGNEMAQLIDERPLSSDPQRFYDTGSYTMNALISGDMFKGVPEGKITSLAGDPGTGKTFIALSVVKNFLDEHKDAHVIWYDTENAITKSMFTDRNIDYSRIVYSPVATVEDFKKETMKFLSEYNKADDEDRVPVIMVLDSLGGLTTRKTVDDTLNEKDVVDMTRPKLIKAAMTILALELQKAKIPLIVNNHIYDSISAYSGKQMSGGSGLKFFSSTILFLTKRKDKDGTDQIGNIITARAEKSRFTIENSKAELLLNFKTGLNRYHGLIPFAEELGIIKRVGHRYETFDGKKLYLKELMRNAEIYFSLDVLEQINAKIQETFSYGKMEEDETLQPFNEVVED